MDCSMPGFPIHHQLKLMSIQLVMPSNHLILCCPLLLLPSIFPSIRVFQMSKFFISGGPKCWSFSFNNQSCQWIFKIDFLEDWLAGCPCSPRDSQEQLGQVWVSLLWGHCSFLLGPGAHKVLFVLSKSLFPQSCVSYGGSMVGLMVTSSKRACAIPSISLVS